MELDPTEWQLVSDPFEDWRLHQHVTPLINEPQVGSVTLIIAVKQSKPPILLACHTMKAFSIHPAELKLMKGADIVTVGDCELLKAGESEGFIEPPFFRHPLQLGPQIRKFLDAHSDEVQYRMKHPFHSHRGMIGSAGLSALRKSIEIIREARPSR